MAKHTCHWPTCEREVPPRLWGCIEHWRRLPGEMQRAIWRHYRHGQENDKNPSREYVEASMRAVAWAREQEASDDN